jgi:hypothetical protein
MAINKKDRLGWGLALYPPLAPNRTQSSGLDRLIDALVDRLTDKLFYSSNYGLPLEELVTNSSPQSLASLTALIEGELSNDDRVASITVRTSFDDGTLTINIEGTTADGDDFALVGRTIGSIGAAELRFQAA